MSGSVQRPTAELVGTLDEKYLANRIVFEVMTASAVLFMEGSPLRAADGRLDRTRIRERVMAATWRLPEMRKRLMPAPLGLAAPFWVPVEQLDPEYHVQFRESPVVEGDEALDFLSGREAGPLERDRPLWRLVFAELHDGNVAMVGSWHHAFGDATYGIRIGDAIFSASPEESLPTADARDRVTLGRAPRTSVGAALLVATRWWQEAGSASEAWRRYWAKPFRRRLRRVASRIIRTPRDWYLELSGYRRRLPGRHARLRFHDRETLTARAKALGGSVNDLVVAVALRAVLRVGGGPDAALLVPISRRAGVRDRQRNQISVVRVVVPAGIGLADCVRLVQEQVRVGVRTGESGISRPRSWAGYATHVPWSSRRKYFGTAEVTSVAGWPAGDPMDDVAVLAATFGNNISIAATAWESTDIDALMTSIDADLNPR